MNTLDVQKLLKDIRKTIVHFIVHTQLLLLLLFFRALVFQPRSFFAIQYAYLFIVQVFAFDVAVAIFVSLVELVLPPRAAHTYARTGDWFQYILSNKITLGSHCIRMICVNNRKNQLRKKEQQQQREKKSLKQFEQCINTYSLLSSLAPSHELNMDISHKSYMLIFLSKSIEITITKAVASESERNQCIV